MILEFYDSRDKVPNHESNITYYSVNENYTLTKQLEPLFTEVTYEWYSKCGEVHEYYDPLTQGHYKIGDSKPSKHFSNDENESHRTVYLQIMFNELCMTLGLPSDERYPHFMWNYTHNIRHSVSELQGGGYFPCFDINNLLREGVVEVLDHEQRVIESFNSDENYFHVIAVMQYKGNNFKVKMAQDGWFEDNKWINIKEGKPVYGKVDVFQYELWEHDKIDTYNIVEELEKVYPKGIPVDIKGILNA